MEWSYPQRRGPEWKQGRTGKTLSSISTPPLQLVIIYGIVIFLLWVSQSTEYKAQLQFRAINFQLLLFPLPIFLVLLMAACSAKWLFNHRLQRSTQTTRGTSPWGIAIFVGLLLLLLSYQSSFHSKWFGSLWRSGTGRFVSIAKLANVATKEPMDPKTKIKGPLLENR